MSLSKIEKSNGILENNHMGDLRKMDLDMYMINPDSSDDKTMYHSFLFGILLFDSSHCEEN
jgi:hypothetical protein